MKIKTDNQKGKIFSHFILTIFNVQKGIPGLLSDPNDKSWLEHRFKLFDKFCYPSVLAQSNQDFKWIVLFNVDTPDIFKDEIKKYSVWGNFIPVYIKTTTAKDTNRIFREIIPEYLTDGSEYLITTRIGSDDIICKDYIEMVQNCFDGQKLQFINFSNGYAWNYNSWKIYSKKMRPGHFISLIEKIDNFKTVRTGDGFAELHQVGPIREIETKPTWIQGIHGRNITNQVGGILQPPKTIRNLGRHFGVRGNLLLPSVIGGWSYFGRQALDLTRKIRGRLGLRGHQLAQFRARLLKK